MIYGNLFSDSDNEKCILLYTCSHKSVSLYRKCLQQTQTNTS